MLACRRHRALCREEGAVAASLEPSGNSGCPSLRVQGSEKKSGVSEFHPYLVGPLVIGRSVQSVCGASGKVTQVWQVVAREGR